ncbi:MAG: DUF4136 domain-containing protein [Phycisphaerales bacterium]|nr:MAG: DUF4136 domain-containing protein [Phycisphaerales bacterium]
MNRSLLLSLLSALVFAGCTSVPTKDIEVDAQADPKANFSGYATYAWLGAAAILNDPYGQWEPPTFDADAEIKYLIDRELRKRGMFQNSIDPDLVVAFAAGIDMNALGLKVDPKTKIGALTSVPRGGLAIVLVDSESGFVIWIGVATADIQDQPDAETVKARLDYAVTQLLRKLPKSEGASGKRPVRPGKERRDTGQMEIAATAAQRSHAPDRVGAVSLIP